MPCPLQYLYIPGVLLEVGVFPGVFPGVLFTDMFVDLLATFIGVFAEALALSEIFWADSLQRDVLPLSTVCLRCQRICGPLVNGASILNKLLISFSREKWDIAEILKTEKVRHKHPHP